MRRYYVVVTGASKGIGQATALYLDRLGYFVLAGVRKESDAEALREAASDRLTPMMIDVTSAEQIEAAGDRVSEITADNGLWGLVNNAGIAVPGPLEFLPLADFRRQLEVNVTGQLAVTQAMLPALRTARGRVVMMSSISGRRAVAFAGAYSASKHALEALTDALRQELHPWDMHVVSILPGVIDTPIWAGTAQAVRERLAEGALPERAYTLYGDILRGTEALEQRGKRDGIPPVRVAEAVAEALSATVPKTRYFVGRDAQIVRLLNAVLPPRWLDTLARR